MKPVNRDPRDVAGATPSPPFHRRPSWSARRLSAWRLPIRTLFLATLVALALTISATGGADHCETYSTSDPEVDTTAVECPFYDGSEPCWGATYIDNDPCQIECLFSVWLYQESNGIPGLQRGDEVRDDTCHGLIESDHFPFF